MVNLRPFALTVLNKQVVQAMINRRVQTPQVNAHPSLAEHALHPSGTQPRGKYDQDQQANQRGPGGRREIVHNT